MRTLLVAIATVILPAAAVHAEKPLEKPSAVTVIECKDLKLPAAKGQIGEPKVFQSEDEMAKVIDDKESRAKIAKAVDFKTQQVLFFAWSGSGEDVLAHSVAGDKKTEILFGYTRGRTKDLRNHFALYAVPKDATWKIDGK